MIKVQFPRCTVTDSLSIIYSQDLASPLFFCTVFGFNQTEFRGLERGPEYAVEVGFLRGRPSALVIGTLTLNFGTAGNFIHNFYVLMNLTVFRERNLLISYYCTYIRLINCLFVLHRER